MRYTFQQLVLALSSALALIAVFLVANARAQSVTVQAMRNASAEAGFSDVLKKANVTLNFETAKTTDTLGIVAIKEHWAASLNQRGSAIMGAIYTQRPLTKIEARPGFYVVQARKTDRGTEWLLLKGDGSPATKPIQVRIETLRREIPIPTALMVEGAPDRCCFEDDSVRHCGDCS